ncbi:MAG: FAD-dependent oxidoreductase, partial [Bradyrhizobium sp.]
IAVEMAETFRRLGLEVTMIIRSGKVLRSTLDDDMRELLEAELARYGVCVVSGTPTALEGDEQVEAVMNQEGRYPCDLVLMGMGARPNVELAKAAGVTLGPTGAIATDAYMRTNLPGVYAAGDCAEALNLVTGKPAYIPLGSTANKQGRTVIGRHHHHHGCTGRFGLLAARSAYRRTEMGGGDDHGDAAGDMFQHGMHHGLALGVGEHELLGEIGEDAETMRAGIDHEIDAAALAFEVERAALVEDGGNDREHAAIGALGLVWGDRHRTLHP